MARKVKPGPRRVVAVLKMLGIQAAAALPLLLTVMWNAPERQAMKPGA